MRMPRCVTPSDSRSCHRAQFLGTAFEPDESAFKNFLQKHGGSSNAFTGMESTGFHFQVQPAHLPSALERFAAFFTCPLLVRRPFQTHSRGTNVLLERRPSCLCCMCPTLCHPVTLTARGLMRTGDEGRRLRVPAQPTGTLLAGLGRR